MAPTLTTSGNMRKTTSYLQLFGSAFVVSLLALIYYERKRKRSEEEGKCGACNHKNEEHENNRHDNEDTSVHIKQETIDNVASNSTLTSYSSLEDDDSGMQSCRSTDSSTSAYSTASDDTCPYPVGEFSTYKQQTVDRDLTDFDLQEILNSPIVESHYIDERMTRSPIKLCDEFSQFNNCEDCTNIPGAIESTNVNSIIVAYSDIVPPLCPNTGDTILPSKISNT